MKLLLSFVSIALGFLLLSVPTGSADAGPSAEGPSLEVLRGSPGVEAFARPIERGNVRVVGRVTDPARMGAPAFCRGYEVVMDRFGRLYALGRVGSSWIYVRPDPWVLPSDPGPIRERVERVTNYGADVGDAAAAARSRARPFPREEIVVTGDPSYRPDGLLSVPRDDQVGGEAAGDAESRGSCNGRDCDPADESGGELSIDPAKVALPAFVVAVAGVLYFFHRRG